MEISKIIVNQIRVQNSSQKQMNTGEFCDRCGVHVESTSDLMTIDCCNALHQVCQPCFFGEYADYGLRKLENPRIRCVPVTQLVGCLVCKRLRNRTLSITSA